MRASGRGAEEDAYGQILLATLAGRDAQEVIERDDGVVWAGDPSTYFAPFRKWPAVERRTMRYVRGRVLDVGCGAGRVSLHLQERGHEVVAIDESPGAVEVCRRRGVRDARVLSLAEVDESLGLFDTVLLMRNNFGLAGKESSAAAVLRRIARITPANGRIVTDSVDPHRADPIFLDYHPRGVALRPGAQRIRVRWQRYRTPWFHYIMLEPAELEQLVAGTGWRVARIVDDGSPRYAAVLEKTTGSYSNENGAARRVAERPRRPAG